jgi:hypothetical protein
MCDISDRASRQREPHGANFIVTISFLTLLDAVGGVGTFFLLGFLTLVALTSFWRKVPETSGRSLQEMERDLAVEPGAVEAVPAAGCSPGAGPFGIRWASTGCCAALTR